jgi:hypothetical protein
MFGDGDRDQGYDSPAESEIAFASPANLASLDVGPRAADLTVGVPEVATGRPEAELTGPSDTRQANPQPFGGRHTLMGGSVVSHSVSSFPHSGQG